MKKDHETAIDDFEKADALLTETLVWVESGKFLDSMPIDVAMRKQYWEEVWSKLRRLLDDRNVRLKRAKEQIRQAVSLSPNQERGPEGKATVLSYGGFRVSSTTERRLDPQLLLTLCTNKSLLTDLLNLTHPDTEGQLSPSVGTVYEVDYQSVVDWLRSKGHDDVVTACYREKEGTPRVTGPKESAFLGEFKKS